MHGDTNTERNFATKSYLILTMRNNQRIQCGNNFYFFSSIFVIDITGLLFFIMSVLSCTKQENK